MFEQIVWGAEEDEVLGKCHLHAQPSLLYPSRPVRHKSDMEVWVSLLKVMLFKLIPVFAICWKPLDPSGICCWFQLCEGPSIGSWSYGQRVWSSPAGGQGALCWFQSPLLARTRPWSIWWWCPPMRQTCYWGEDQELAEVNEPPQNYFLFFEEGFWFQLIPCLRCLPGDGLVLIQRVWARIKGFRRGTRSHWTRLSVPSMSTVKEVRRSM